MTTDLAMGQAFDSAVNDLDNLISRHFVARRTIVVSNDEVKFWTAAIGDDVLYRSPDGKATLRFARTFAERTPGVTVEVEEVVGHDGYSVRVDNVVPIGGR